MNKPNKRIIIVGSRGYVGSFITEALQANGYEIFSPSSTDLNLNTIQSISKTLRNESFAAIIYCAIEKKNQNFIDINIRNLKNLLSFQNQFDKWIHISSRSVYDSFEHFENILPIPVTHLPRPKMNQYSQLKYDEENLLNASIPQKLIILRAFDIYSKSCYTEITHRWEEQIKKNGFCKKEILSPISHKELTSAVVLAIENPEINGTLNICGNKKISSEGMSSNMTNPDPNVYEHSGLYAMSNITTNWLIDYYLSYENRNRIIHLLDENNQYKGYLDFSAGINSIESGSIVYHKLTSPDDIPQTTIHNEDIESYVSALSILPAFAEELENYLSEISDGQTIYLDADERNSLYIIEHLPNIKFSTNALSTYSFETRNCQYVLSLKISKRLKHHVFKGATVFLLNELLEIILLHQLLSHLNNVGAIPIFIEGPKEEQLQVDIKSEPYLFTHTSLENCINDRLYIKKFYRNDKRQLGYALDPNAGILAGNMVTSNGIHLMSAFFESDTLNVNIDGERMSNLCFTNDVERDIWMFGSCLIFGLFSTDDMTPASQLQKKINMNHYNWRVHNMGVKGKNNNINDIVFALNTQIREDDILVFVGIYPDCVKRVLFSHGKIVHNFSEYLNNVGFGNQCFLNSSFHCNLEIYHHLANFVYNIIPKKNGNKNSSAAISYFDTCEKLPLIDSSKLLDMAFMQPYLNYLNINKFTIPDKNIVVGSIVMAANPFTLGHGGIVDVIASNCDYFYVFIIEDSDFNIPFSLRLQMAKEYCSKHTNCKVLPTGNFFGARFLFPEYHNRKEFENKPIKPPFIDTLVFAKLIAPLLGITRRYIGTEANDNVTNQFNLHLLKVLPKYGIEACVIDRITLSNGAPISASFARHIIETGGKVETLLNYLPKTTIDILISEGYYRPM